MASIQPVEVVDPSRSGIPAVPFERPLSFPLMKNFSGKAGRNWALAPRSPSALFWRVMERKWMMGNIFKHCQKIQFTCSFVLVNRGILQAQTVSKQVHCLKITQNVAFEFFTFSTIFCSIWLHFLTDSFSFSKTRQIDNSSILAFSTNFCPIKSDQSGNTV